MSANIKKRNVFIKATAQTQIRKEKENTLQLYKPHYSGRDETQPRTETHFYVRYNYIIKFTHISIVIYRNVY